ncbi:MAG: hypothetical protein E7045_02805 [Lentisphaerae bacterium]|nr:hypothetical protein [Lentisphaerota bacterium]
MDKSLKSCLLTAGTSALIIRVLFGILFPQTELAAFNSLPGLDMDTLLSFAEWDTGNPASAPMFVLHRFLLIFCYTVCKEHNFMLIYILQALTGVAASVCTAWSVWMLVKNRRAAMFAGVLYALYGPFLLYESVALQESILTHTLAIGFSFYLWFIQSGKFSAGLLAGLVFGLNSAGRPASAFAVLVFAAYPFIKERKFNWKNLSVISGISAIWLAASIFNGYFRADYSPFFNVMPHLIEVHNAPRAVQGTAQTFDPVSARLAVLWGAIKNVPYLFGMREVPENLDYDVIRQILPVISLGPLLVMPFAAAGAAVFAAMKRKDLLLLYIAIAALMIPLSARIPIGRYRLMLMPFFIAFAAILLAEIIENPGRRLAMIAVVIGVVGTNMLFCSPLVRPNPAAHHTLALAAVKLNRDPGKHLQKAWDSSGHTYWKSGLMLLLNSLKKQDIAAAEKIISQDKSQAPEFIYYLAVIRTAQRRFTEAKLLLKQIPQPEKLGALHSKYLFLVNYVEKMSPAAAR